MQHHGPLRSQRLQLFSTMAWLLQVLKANIIFMTNWASFLCGKWACCGYYREQVVKTNWTFHRDTCNGQVATTKMGSEETVSIIATYYRRHKSHELVNGCSREAAPWPMGTKTVAVLREGFGVQWESFTMTKNRNVVLTRQDRLTMDRRKN